MSHLLLALVCKAMPKLILQLQPACLTYGQQKLQCWVSYSRILTALEDDLLFSEQSRWP